MAYNVSNAQECRYVRIRQLKASAESSYLILSKWELFGQLRVIGQFPDAPSDS
jgi:hypothetical protein